MRNKITGEPSSGLGSWRMRRLYLWVVSAVSIFAIVFPLLTNMDTRPAETAMTMGFVTLIACTGTYVFGAAWDDRNKMQYLGARLGEDMDDKEQLRRAVVRTTARRIAETRVSDEVLDDALEDVGRES